MDRRKLIKFLAAVPLGLAAGAMYVFKIEPEWVEFTEVDMELPHAPVSAKGMKIIQISDLHIGHRFDWSYMKKAFRKVEDLKPDLVLYTGDYVSYKNDSQLEELKRAALYFPKGKKATLASLGNHDYGIGWAQRAVADKITDILKAQDIRTLRNETAEIEGVNIVGLEDYWGANWSTAAAKTVLDKGSAHIALCHNPDVCDLPIWDGFKGFVLAGHTHGGQVKPPFLKAPMLPVKNKNYSQGLIEINSDIKLYINRAIGCLWPVRFNVRPEVTVFKVS